MVDLSSPVFPSWTCEVKATPERKSAEDDADEPQYRLYLPELFVEFLASEGAESLYWGYEDESGIPVAATWPDSLRYTPEYRYQPISGGRSIPKNTAVSKTTTIPVEFTTETVPERVRIRDGTTLFFWTERVAVEIEGRQQTRPLVFLLRPHEMRAHDPDGYAKFELTRLLARLSEAEYYLHVLEGIERRTTRAGVSDELGLDEEQVGAILTTLADLELVTEISPSEYVPTPLGRTVIRLLDDVGPALGGSNP